MILGTVVGSVWATRKHQLLAQYKLLLIRPHFSYNPTHEIHQLVAVDTLGAGVGEDVVVCLGSPARASLGSPNLPVDAAVLAIVDRCQFVREAFSPRARRPLRFLGQSPPRQVDWL